MFPGVLAKILQLILSATTQQPTQEQEQPVDFLLLVRNDRPRRVRFPAEQARREHHVQRRAPTVAHCLDVLPNLGELGPHVVLHLVAPLAPLALDSSADFEDSLAEEVAEAVNRGASIGSPRVYRWY